MDERRKGRVRGRRDKRDKGMPPATIEDVIVALANLKKAGRYDDPPNVILADLLSEGIQAYSQESIKEP